MQSLLIFVMSAAALLILDVRSAQSGFVGTNFTYQGSLSEAGSPANGSFDFLMRLYTQPSAGVHVGGIDVLLEDVNVTNGIFTASLDFGGDVFNMDSDRWLDIQVRPGASTGAYTLLTPRQEITAAPFALFALDSKTSYWSSTGSGIRNKSNGFVGVNRPDPITSSEQFGVHSPATSDYGGMYASTAGDGKPFYGYKTPSSVGWTYMDGANGNWHLNLAGNDRLTCTPAGAVGIGTQTPDSKLEVIALTGHAIEGSTTAASSFGVYGTGTRAGTRGVSSAAGGSGVLGENGTAGGFGVRGEAFNTSSYGVAGYTSFGTGVYGSNGGSNTTGHAGYFAGRVHVAGTLSKSSGSFKIDHPLDPANKTLSHSFVESPDMMNIYNGIAVTDESGLASIEMPDWFDALNRDFRYQLTPIGGFAQLCIQQEMQGRTFVVRSDKPQVRVSWQVTGIRQDVYARAHPIVVEEPKLVGERGTYLFPEGYAKVKPGADANERGAGGQ